MKKGEGHGSKAYLFALPVALVPEVLFGDRGPYLDHLAIPNTGRRHEAVGLRVKLLTGEKKRGRSVVGSGFHTDAVDGRARHWDLETATAHIVHVVTPGLLAFGTLLTVRNRRKEAEDDVRPNTQSGHLDVAV